MSPRIVLSYRTDMEKLAKTIALLRKHYGEPEPPPADDPFELILWEQVAYLASDERRVEAFERLAAKVGLD